MRGAEFGPAAEGKATRGRFASRNYSTELFRERRGNSISKVGFQMYPTIGLSRNHVGLFLCLSAPSSLISLRQNVGRLLVTTMPALDLNQVNYECDVIDEILDQVLMNTESFGTPDASIEYGF